MAPPETLFTLTTIEKLVSSNSRPRVVRWNAFKGINLSKPPATPIRGLKGKNLRRTLRPIEAAPANQRLAILDWRGSSDAPEAPQVGPSECRVKAQMSFDRADAFVQPVCVCRAEIAASA